MLENFGGPVWHASVSAGSMHMSEMLAESALDGVGDAGLGEWRTPGERAFHIRRRLTPTEAANIEIKDLRNTPVGKDRLRRLFARHPHLKHVALSLGEWKGI